MLRRCKHILILLPICILMYSSIAGASAKIKIPFDSWNFGDINSGDVLSHNFELYNTGKSVLSISDIHTSCGCEAVMLLSESIASGKMGTIQVRLDTSAIKIGKFKKYINVYSNALKKPHIRLTVSGVVIGPAEPKIIIHKQVKNLGVFFNKQSKEFNIKIGNEGKKNLKLKALKNKKYLTTKTKLGKIILKPGEEKEITFSLTQPVKDGAFSILFGISSNDPKRPVEYVKLKGYVTKQKALIIYRNKEKTILFNGLDGSIRINGKDKIKSAESYSLEGKSAKIDFVK